LGELAEKLLVTGGNVTYVMDRLEDQGLVYRDWRPDARRAIRARLTQEGRDLVADVFPGHASHVEHLARHLSVEEQTVLRTLLKTLGTGIKDNDL
jgi:MarR family 2-MHQ and catechol resistance regulon transcriptional repressor